MTIFHSIFLGLIQGAAEFLPISSSAHLILAPRLLHFPDPGLSFDVALHAGTLVAIILYFYKDWINIFKLALQNFQFSIFPPKADQPLADKSISNDKILNSKNTKYKIQDTRYKPLGNS